MLQNYVTRYWIEKGVPPSKLIFGIPFFGRSFTLLSANDTEIGAPIKDLGREGAYTRHPGLLAYFEICDLMRSGRWEQYRDESGFPYIVNGDQWVGYDDIDSIRQKVLIS